MLSKSQISFLKSLQQKKNRKIQGFFLVEGIKSVAEFINSNYIVETIYYTPAVATKMLNLSQKINLWETTTGVLEKFSSLTTTPDIIALIRIPLTHTTETPLLQQSFTLALDGVQDPGNMGTIIRTADWFGIKNIICSHDTVDVYNPKVVQATMGSLARFNVHYTDLPTFLDDCPVPVFGALLAGENIYTTDFGINGILVMGNEGNGIRPEVEKLVHKRITIPQAGKTESLNVAIATAIFCSEIYRKSFK